MVNELIWPVPPTLKFTVILFAVTVVLLTVTSFAPPPPETLAPVAVPVPALNRHPLGAVRMSVPLPVTKSPLAPSVMTMLPSVVKAGDVAFWALSAEMLVPPVAWVMVTAASVSAAPSKTEHRTRKQPRER